MYGLVVNGKAWPSVRKKDLPSLLPEIVGFLSKSLRVSSGVVELRGGIPKVEVECVKCGFRAWRNYYRVMNETCSCRPCMSRERNPFDPRKRGVYDCVAIGNVVLGRLLVIGEVQKPTGPSKPSTVRVKCTDCGREYVKAVSEIRRGGAGCKSCSKSSGMPNWLLMRCRAAKKRCSNPNDPYYPDYGGRGIEYHFSSPTEMARWISENLGLHKELSLDRIDNNDHYRPGNLRYATMEEQANNRRKRRAWKLFHVKQSD